MAPRPRPASRKLPVQTTEPDARDGTFPLARAATRKPCEMSGVAVALTLFAICVMSIAIRLFSVVRWGSVIHEYDPHFNYRVTKFLAQDGAIELLNWFDDRAWFPLGRIVGTTVYPGLMITAAAFHALLGRIGVHIAIRHVCVLLAPLFAALSSIALFLLTREVTNRNTTALLAAMLLAVSPASMSRSSAGAYDNEAIAIFLLLLTFYCWVVAVRTGSMAIAAAAAVAYFCMASSWGGYVLIANLVPLHVATLLLSGRYSPRLYIAYATFYPLATLLTMQVPFIGFNAVLKAENAASHAVFALLQAVAFLQFLQHQLAAAQFTKLVTRVVAAAAVVVTVALVAALALGKLQWSGRSLTLLIPTYASRYIPIVASVGEHQPTTWSSFYLALGPAMLFSPLGLYYAFADGRNGAVFMILYSVVASYFAGVMVRLLLTLAPAACFLSALGLSTFLDRVAVMTRTLATNDLTGGNAAEPPVRSRAVLEQEADAFAGETLAALSVKLRFATPPKAMKTSLKPREIPSAIGLLVLAVCALLVIHVRQSVQISRRAYSSTSLVHERWNVQPGEKAFNDDYREAFMWLRQNTPADATVLCWWDYGYQISSLANRTVIVDNNTWNNTHIATVGRVLTATEDAALPILHSIGADYVLVVFGGKSGMSGDDLDKLSWIAKITEGVFPDATIASEFQVDNRFVVHANATTAMTSSLLYKLSYTNFADVVTGGASSANGSAADNATTTTTTRGFDQNRKVSVTHRIELEHFDQVFTSEEWIVRIYKVKQGRSMHRP